MFSYNPHHKSLQELEKYISELDILQNYFPDIKHLPTTINSPLRQDIHPSFSIFKSKDKVLYKDFSTGESGDIYTLLEKIWGCDFVEVIDRLYKELNVEKYTVHTTRTNSKIHIKSNSELLCKVRDWKNYDIEYWESYGVTLPWLEWAEVYPISHIIIDKDNHRYVFKAEKLAYTFVERKEGKVTHKIYQPLTNDKRKKWYNKHDKSVVSLWTKIPEYGDKVVICSSLKDALCLSCNTKIPALSIQGESYGMSDTAINELKRRYKKQYIILDNDTVGLKDAVKLSERTGFENIVLPQFEGGKDISDLYKVYGKRKFIELIKNLFENDKERTI